MFKYLAIDCCLVSPSSAADPEIFPRRDGGWRDKGGDWGENFGRVYSGYKYV